MPANTAPNGDCPPGERCVPCRAGTLEVIVWEYAVCWRTSSAGLDTQDPPFAGVTVRVSGGEFDQEESKVTDDSGKAVFDDLFPGDYDIHVEKAGYEDVTDDLTDRLSQDHPPNVRLTRTAEVQTHQTAYADLVMCAKRYRKNGDGTWTPGRECDRRHPNPGGAGGPGGTLGAILWADEPGMLAARDWAWIFLLVLVAGSIAGAAGVLGGHWLLFLGGILAAFAAYLTGVIFGEGPGTVAIVAAGIAFAALLVAAIVLAVMARFGSPPSSIDTILIPAFIGILSGMWAAFGFAYSQCPAGVYKAKPAWWRNARLLGLMLAGVAVALIVYLVFAALFGVSGMTIVMVLVTLVLSVFWCHHAALTGMTFKNEGDEDDFGDSDYKLPYLGDRYCLQGAHGYWSHFAAVEGAYDWCMPDRTDVVCSKEGHIIGFWDQELYEYYLPLQNPNDDVHIKTGSTSYQEDASSPMAGANYVGVRHQDGSVAFYSWLMTNGVTGKDWGPELKTELGTGHSGQRSLERGGSNLSDIRDGGGFNGIHVRLGHVLGGCGWTDSDNPTTDTAFPDAPKWGFVALGVFVLILGIAFVMALGANYAGPPPARIGVGTDTATNSYCPPAADTAADLAGKTQGSGTSAVCSNPKDIDCISQLNCQNVRPSVSNIFQPTEGFDNQYCEALQMDGWVKQPWATWSAPIGFGIFGLTFLGIYAVHGSNGKPFRNRMTATWWYPLTLGLILIINGPGSMIFHTTFNGFWSEFDPCGMSLFTAFIAAYNITRILNAAQGWFWLMFLGVVALVVFLIFFLGGQGVDSTPIFAGTVGLAMITELLCVFFCHVITDKKGVIWFWSGLLVFVTALMIWKLGHTGQPFCSSRFIATSFPWPHPLWHLMGAAAMFCFGMSYVYQKDPEPCYPRLHFEVLEAPPVGPSVDAPDPGGPEVPHNRYRTVKFTDGSTGIHSNQPRSMRKYTSENTSIGKPVIPPVALFRPENNGTGSHTPDSVPDDAAQTTGS